MGFFGHKAGPLDAVAKVSVFPKIGSAVLRKDDKLVVFSPAYLLGKHGNASSGVASKFMNLKSALQLLELIDRNVSAENLSGPKVEIKELDFGSEVGTDSLVELSNDLVGVLPEEDVRGNKINVIYTKRDRIPKTRLLNIILLPFNPQYGQGIEALFKEKYKWVGFEQFRAVYAVVTIYPGRYAPPMNDTSFWSRYALLKEM